MDSISRENFVDLLGVFIEENKLSTKKVAKAIGCSEMTLTRLILGKTLPTDEMLKQTGLMMGIGFKKYSKLSEAEKEKISEMMGTVGGGVVGFASITAAISVLGTTAGLSAAGITSGLAALGAVAGGGMVAGVTVAAAIPIATGVAGYGLIKLIKGGAGELQVNMKNINKKWEMTIEEEPMDDSDENLDD